MPIKRRQLKNTERRTRFALTVLELVVTIAILATLAGLLLSNLDGINEEAESTATLKTLTETRDAYIRFWQDIKHSAPVRNILQPSVLSPETLQLVASPRGLLENPDLDRDGIRFDFPEFDAETQIGWRGPYVGGQAARYRYTAANLPNQPELHDDDAFTVEYGAGPPLDPYGFSDDLSIRDSFRSLRPAGRPVVIQIVPIVVAGRLTRFDARVVSAAADGMLTIPLGWSNDQLLLDENAAQLGDDIYVAFDLRP